MNDIYYFQGTASQVSCQGVESYCSLKAELCHAGKKNGLAGGYFQELGYPVNIFPCCSEFIKVKAALRGCRRDLFNLVQVWPFFIFLRPDLA